MSEFQQAHEARAISFPPLGNCRIMRRVRHVAAGADSHAPERIPAVDIARDPEAVPREPGCYARGTPPLIRPCHFYGMRVQFAPASGSGDASRLARDCHLELALVRTTQKSRCVSTASGFLVSTAGVRDAFGDENSDTVAIHCYCSVDNLLSFKMDPPNRAKHRDCLLLIAGCSKEAITVHSVTHIDEAAVTEA
eukprot:8643619-Pyramimonas_sp.AAC.1